MEKFYITTTLPYVNAAPHLGFALEIVQADALARYRRSKGDEVFFNTGTDEHGAKIYQNAVAEGKTPEEYVRENASHFKRLLEALTIDLQHGRFIRTTEPAHLRAAQEFWKRCVAAGDIYKAHYRVKYCVGCELEKTDSELENGRCPLHQNLSIETREEENYFFKFSKYREPLLELYRAFPDIVVPFHRLTEVKNFVEAGINDFSVSRLKEKMPWGVPVPGDDQHVMYVWFDALVNYVSTLGWPDDEARFDAFWGTKEAPRAVQIAGKDNLRQQAAMWQAMLMSAGLPPSRKILIHGFITSGGGKMSKSTGNVIDPFQIVESYGVDALRYWLLKEIPPFEDGDFTREKFEERYRGELANGIGNFSARVLALGARAKFSGAESMSDAIAERVKETEKAVDEYMSAFQWNEALGAIGRLIAFGDGYVNEKKPWETNDPYVIFDLVMLLDRVAALLVPFLPSTAHAIAKCIVREGGTLTIKKGGILFPRLS